MSKVIISFSEVSDETAFTEIKDGTMPDFDPDIFGKIENNQLSELVERIKSKTLPLLPDLISFEHPYRGISATDLFSLNTLLGSTIENTVVRFLNEHRHLWDPQNEWQDYRFIRSSEFFPDVRLTHQTTKDILFGIELKSWFLLSKEGEPSFRYKTASSACTHADLLCVLPWYLEEAVSGIPVLTTPWIYSAKAASEACKRHWTYRKTDTPKALSERTVQEPENITPYNDSREQNNYSPVGDNAGNFGRLARTGIMDEFVKVSLDTDVLGIPARNWMRFLKAHTDKKTLEQIKKNIDTIVNIPNNKHFQKIIKELQDYIEQFN